MVRTLQDRQKENWALVSRSDAPNKKLVIFVHGFRGSYLSTWGEMAHYLLNHADDDNNGPFSGWDYLFIGYETGTVGSFLTIAKLIATQWRRARGAQAPYKSTYGTFALVGHSLGTLGIRQLLCALSEHPKGMMQALHCVLLVGSPINGSPLAWLGKGGWILDFWRKGAANLAPTSYAIAEALKPNSPQLEMLHVWNSSIQSYAEHYHVPTKVILGADDRIVGQGGLVEWAGDICEMTPLSHGELCKVAYEGPTTQCLILDRLREELK